MITQLERLLAGRQSRGGGGNTSYFGWLQNLAVCTFLAFLARKLRYLGQLPLFLVGQPRNDKIPHILKFPALPLYGLLQLPDVLDVPQIPLGSVVAEEVGEFAEGVLQILVFVVEVVDCAEGLLVLRLQQPVLLVELGELLLDGVVEQKFVGLGRCAGSALGWVGGLQIVLPQHAAFMLNFIGNRIAD